MKRYDCSLYEAYRQDGGEYVKYEDVINLINDCLVLHPLSEWHEHTEGWTDALSYLLNKIENNE
jgi:hypothetical protein